MDDDSIVQIISRLGVDFGQAIVSAEKLAASVNIANTSLTNLKATAAAMGAMTVGQAGVTKATENATQATNKYKKSVHDLNKEYGVLGSQFDRRTGWFVAGTAFFGSITAMKEIVTTVKDVEMGMTTIARITEDVNFNFKEMRDDLQGLGIDYGMTWANTSDIAIKWAQAGYNTADTLELTKSSLLALNTAELNATQATQGLIAIMAQWGLTADQLLPTIDKINVTADNYAVSSQDLVDGLNRSSGAAKVLGLTLNETIGILTVMREATGRTGREVGNALNSILSFMQRPTAIKAFETQGIQVFADEARTQFRNVIQIFDEMAAKWPTMSPETQDIFSQQAEQAGLYSEEMAEAIGLQEQWTDIQQRDLSQAAAGIYRRNYLLALLQNWSKVDEVLIGLEGSLGYSMKENERTMDTLAKQYEALKAAAEQFAVAIGDAGLLDQLKGLVEGTTDAIKWFNNLDNGMKTLIITFGEVAIAIKLVSSLMGMMGLAGAGGMAEGLMKGWAVPLGIGAMTKSGVIEAKKLTAELNAVGKTKLAAPTYAIQNMSKGMIALKTATSGATVALRNMGAGIVAAFGGPWVLGITAAAAAVYTLYKEVKTANETFEHNAVFAGNMIKQYDQLQQRVQATTKSTKEHVKAAEEYNDMLSTIGQKMPELIEGYDELSGHLKINEQKFRELAAASGDVKKGSEAVENAIEAEIDVFNQQAQAEEKSADTMERNKQLLKDLVSKRNELSNALKAQSDNAENTAKVEEDLSEIDQLIAETAIDGGLARLKAKDFTNEAVDAEIVKLEEARVQHFKNVEEFKGKEAEKTQKLAEEIQRRLKLYEAEIRALGDGNAFAQKTTRFITQLPLSGAVGPASKFINYGKEKGWDWAENASKYTPEGLVTGSAKKALQNESAELDAKLSELEDQKLAAEQAILDAKKAVLDIANSDAPGGDNPPPGGGSGSAAKEIDYLAEALERLADAANQYELANMDIESTLTSVNDLLNNTGAEYDYLNSKVEAGTATSADYARMQELIATKTALLNNEQMQLTNANQQYKQEIDSLTPLLAKATEEYERFKAAGDEEHTKDAADAVSSLKSEIDSLSGSIASNTQEIWANKGALDELTNAAYNSYYQQTMAWMQHMEAIGRMNDELEAEILANFDKTKMTLQDWWKVEEDQFQNRLDRLKEERDRIKEAYDERMEMYEAEIEANEELIERKEDQLDSAKSAIDGEIAAIRELMALLDEDAESEDREEAARQHNEKLAELAEERLYHELRTGTEHVEAITDIDKQIAEENRRWQLQQNDWSREDQKDAYQDQIDALEDEKDALEKSARQEIDLLKKTNDRKKQEMQKFYSELESILNDSNLRMMAASQTNGENFIQRMAEIARRATEAFNGNLSFDSVLDDAMGLTDDAGNSGGGNPSNPYNPPSDSGGRTIATVLPGQYENRNGTTYMASRQLANLLKKSVDWNGSQVLIDGKPFTPAWNDNGTTYLSIRQVAERLGYSVKWDAGTGVVSILDKAHDGAKVMRDGAAVLKHDERILSPSLTKTVEKLSKLLSHRDIFEMKPQNTFTVDAYQQMMADQGHLSPQEYMKKWGWVSRHDLFEMSHGANLVAKPNLSSAADQSSSSQNGIGVSSADLDRIANKIVTAIEHKSAVQINGPAVNIEHAGFEDKADMRVLGIETRSILMAKG